MHQKLLHPRSAAINVDVDSLYLYYRIHGMGDDEASNAVWERGVLRFLELFSELGLKATFFVVAQDLLRWPKAMAMAERCLKEGHELGSHSLTHPYELIHLPDEALRHELTESKRLIEELKGAPISGFRAPGYTMDKRVLQFIEEAGYTYDSSFFPCPPYYLAKLAVLGKMALSRKKSHSIVGHPSVMWESTVPTRRGKLVEWPITVLPGLRFPFIGTSVLMMGERGYGMVRPWLKRLHHVNFELHGIDLCDLEEDGIDRRLLKQPDMKHSLETKLRLFRRIFKDLDEHWGVRTLASLTEESLQKQGLNT